MRIRRTLQRRERRKSETYILVKLRHGRFRPDAELQKTPSGKQSIFPGYSSTKVRIRGIAFIRIQN